MTAYSRFVRRIGIGFLAVTALVVAPLAALPSQANTAGTGVVINEVYLSGGSAGAAYSNKFIELYNPGASSVSLAEWSLQYRPATSTGAASGVVALSGSIAPSAYFLVQGGSNGVNGAPLPTPDVVGTLNPSGSAGTIILSNSASALTLPAGSITGNPAVVDLLGYGTSNTFETADAAAPAGNTDVKSLVRTAFADSDSNASDFTLTATITPKAGGPSDPGGPTDPPVALSIAEIQGTTDVSPQVGKTVETTGVVTAAYPTGGFNGFYLQTAGTGGALDLDTHTASDGIFVYSPSTVASVEIGDHVKVTGAVSEFSHLTELSVASAAGLTELDKSGIVAPVPTTVGFPATDAQRESLEGMLVAPQGAYTVTDNYSTNQYGEIELAHDTSPLLQPTAVAPVGTAGYLAAMAKNAAISVTLDDGASTNFLSAANTGKPLPWLSLASPLRIGAPVTFTRPVILDFRNSLWKLQPTAELTPADAAAVQPAVFANTRTTAPKKVGGTLKVATFNVLNYFPTTGEKRVGCTYYTDREGVPTTVNNSDAPGCGVRGAANEASFQRQQAKIVTAIGALGADIVSLEEIENSAKLGQDRDAAVATLVTALNAKGKIWGYVPSPATVPAAADEDVIRTAFIYRTAAAKPVGSSSILIGSPAFANAREPLAQAFQPVRGKKGSTFLIIANHFKSKSPGATTGDNVDAGQGAYNGDRTRQAQELIAFAEQQKKAAKTDKVLLVGDFNSYEQEDPILTLAAAGYVDQVTKTGKQTYAFDGMVGSLDHVFASRAADRAVSGADVWNINSVESVGLEYSRFNANVTNLYEVSAYRSSDHDPVILGLDLPTKGGGHGGGDDGHHGGHDGHGGGGHGGCGHRFF
ncbi:ExeM/NucH family extracellular endonuclease [Glaciihabitans sp. INWT7]|uniref:ExeM/NucH family extracellular endonuclease n=1 Tax=Glaciihabitans sp. INWT7 TaxID=2596912 RepID=UPI002102C37A|nr:ExeM/NucH family extracellular endonuclease [Glaciihabitans sp. INWT7]